MTDLPGAREKLPVNSWGPMYFEYIVGNYDEDNPFVTDIIADQHYIVGAIKVWNDSEKIYVSMILTTAIPCRSLTCLSEKP